MNKKGLSDVVTTVLIILLVLAAVVIIWGFLRTFVFNSASGIESGSLTSSFSIKKGSLVDDGTNVSFALRRDAGAADIAGFIVSYENSQGEKKTFRVNSTIKELESVAITLYYS